MRPLFVSALFSQAMVAVITVGGELLQYALRAGPDRSLALAYTGLGLLCMLPVIFTHSIRAYHWALLGLATALSLLAVVATVNGSPGLIAGAAAAWWVLVRRKRDGRPRTGD